MQRSNSVRINPDTHELGEEKESSSGSTRRLAPLTDDAPRATLPAHTHPCTPPHGVCCGQAISSKVATRTAIEGYKTSFLAATRCPPGSV